MLVSVLPFEFEFREHLYLWKKYSQRGELIPWETARDYFRKPAFFIDYRDPDHPVLAGQEPA